MTRPLNVWCFAVALFVSACASVESKVYAPAQINEVKAWFLAFAYETGSVEALQRSTGDAEVKVISKGQLPNDLQLRDDLFYLLREQYSLPITKKSSEASGWIRLHATHFLGGGFKLLTVTFVDKNGDTLARIKVFNGDRNATFMDDEDFGRYAARAISNTIQKK